MLNQMFFSRWSSKGAVRMVVKVWVTVSRSSYSRKDHYLCPRKTSQSPVWSWSLPAHLAFLYQKTTQTGRKLQWTNRTSILGSLLAWLTRLQQPWDQNRHRAWNNWNCYKAWGIYQLDSQIKQCEERSNWASGWLVYQKNTQLILTARFNVQTTSNLSQKQYPGCTGNI